MQSVSSEFKLSVIVITKNEALNIRTCLESVGGLADEIIVVDSGSIDGTQSICREMGATVVETDWPGFGPQKNRALQLARGEWVLSLDADEHLSPALREEIKSVLDNHQGKLSAYYIPRKSSYCGQVMKHSGWWPDQVVRLFRKNTGRFTDAIVHEKVVFEGPSGELQNHLIHLAIISIEQSISKMNAYSTAGSIQLAERGIQASVSKAVLKGLWAFFRTYILRLGILDGKLGFILSVANAEGVYYRYIKSWINHHKDVKSNES
ncbi:MAG: glycosyltransferase family 2 protein [Burkholderiaceae bacterium]|jgi:glycosyltransferase involved in cell wall biosynthesis|nr:glycosyltransferase family 2 protein [Burkholderiaceae bacterium]